MKRYYRKNSRALLTFAVTNVFASVSSVCLAFLLGAFADIALAGDLERVWRLAAATFLYIGIETYLDYRMQYTRDAVVHKIGMSLRSDIVRKIEGLPYWEKQKKDDGSYISILNNDVATVEQEYLDSMGAIFFQLGCFVIAVVASVKIQPVMSVIMLLVSVSPVVFPKLTEKRLQDSKEEEQQAKASHLAVLTQILNGFFVLKIFDSFSNINRVYDEKNTDLCNKKTRFSQMQSALYAGAYGCGNLVFLGTWVVGMFFVMKGLITLPLLLIFSQLMTFVAGPIQIISERYSLMVAASAVCKRLLLFIDAPTEEERIWGASTLENIEEIKLENISCCIGDRELLQGVNMVLHKGDRVALLGESGSGKSTLMKVLASMYEGEGGYTINGISYRSYQYPDFRRKVMLLEQKSFVFDSSIRDNISMFSEKKGDEDRDLLSAIERAGLSKWYESRGASLDAAIGSEKQALSGGEERRLDLTRILYHCGSMVMLDEPSAGLDPESRFLIEQTITKMECDILIVAMHEYSPEFLNTFNRIITMRDGKITVF